MKEQAREGKEKNKWWTKGQPEVDHGHRRSDLLNSAVYVFTSNNFKSIVIQDF